MNGYPLRTPDGPSCLLVVQLAAKITPSLKSNSFILKS